MKFKFLGDTKNMKVFGYDFSNGATPDVTDEKVIAKLQGNAEFEVVEEVQAPPAPPAPPAKEEKAKADKKEEKPKEDKAPAAGDGENGNLPLGT